MSAKISSFFLVLIAIFYIGGMAPGLSESNSSQIPRTPLNGSLPIFDLFANPTAINTFATVPGTSSISIVSNNGFSGIVTLSVTSTIPSDCTATISSTKVLTVICLTGKPQFTLVLTGISGSLVVSIDIPVTVDDFSISPNSPTIVNAFAGVPADQPVTVNGTIGFYYFVTLTVDPPPGLYCLGSPTLGGAVVGGGFARFDLLCTAYVAGDYPVFVHGTGGPVTHTSGVIIFHVQDFSITTKPALISLNNGRQFFYSLINVTASNGFSGTISLSTSVTPASAFKPNLFPGSVTLSSTKTTGWSILYFLPFRGTIIPVGTYEITVVGTSNGLSHKATITVIVSSP